METLAMRWARVISNESRTFRWTYVVTVNGVIWILLYFLLFPDYHLLLAVGFLFLFLGFHLFERVGLLLIFDEELSKRRSDPAFEPDFGMER